MAPIQRIDPKPVVLVHDQLDGAYKAIAHHPYVYASIRKGRRLKPFFDQKQLSLPEKERVVYFAETDQGPFLKEEQFSPSRGRKIATFFDGKVRPAIVISTRIELVHATAFDPTDLSAFAKVRFFQTTVKKEMWGRAGYTAVVEKGLVLYATTSRLGCDALHETFGMLFASARHSVHLVAA